MLPKLRLLPLLASATEIVHGLGLGKYQIGRSHECDFPAQVLDLPICTTPAIDVSGSSAEIDANVKTRLAKTLSIYDVDAALVAQLGPSHIITQTQCKVCAVSAEDVQQALCESLGYAAKIICLEPYALEDLWQDIERVAEGCGVSERGQRYVKTLQTNMAKVQKRCEQAPRHPRVAAIEWLEPLMAAGNWVPELIKMAGGHNLFGQAGRHSPCMTWDELRVADPDVIVALPCGFDLQKTRQEMHWLTGRNGWQGLAAVKAGRVYLCDGNQYMNRPGPRLVESLKIFAEILHPNLFQPTFEGSGWGKF